VIPALRNNLHLLSFCTFPFQFVCQKLTPAGKEALPALTYLNYVAK